MIPSKIPNYSIQFMAMKPFDEAKEDEVQITNRLLTGPEGSFPPQIQAVVDDVATLYMKEYGQYVKGSAKARITFSIDNGMTFNSSSDPRMETIFKKGISAVVVPKANIEPGEFSSVLTIVPNNEITQEAQQNYPNEPFVVFDPWSFFLSKLQIKRPIRVNLELTRRLYAGQRGDCTTGPLRFPHLLKDLAFQIPKPNKDLKVCIVGPGLLKEEKATPSCPQFVEIYSLFPDAEYLLLDRDENALDILSGQFHKCKFAAYDPSMLRAYTEKAPGKFKPDQSYQEIFASMKNSLGERLLSPKNGQNMLKGDGPVERLVVKVDPKKIEVRKFDINTSHLEENEQFDVIVATMSIANALEDKIKEDPECDRLSYLEKFLGKLKEKGSLYIDTYLLATYLGPLDKVIEDLEHRMKSQLSVKEIPLSDFQPAHLGMLGVLDSITISSLNQFNDERNVTSSSLTVITRLPKKIETKDDN